ncbi:MAG TPA: hypothetical protein VG733_01110 [Chthoniobacteraceae bacterium]|nr:hypothetical protein [Chthoniobacteraceae bacterium]
MKTFLFFESLVAAALISFSPTPYAQDYRGSNSDSLELRITRAPSVVCGVIAKVTGGPTDPDRKDGPYTYTLLVKVNEVLKGNIRDKTLKFALGGVRPWPQLEEWAHDRTPFLWFLDEKGRMGGQGVMSEQSYICLPPPKNSTYIYSMDMTRLTTADEILGRARAFAARKVVSTHTQILLLPVETEAMGLGDGNLGANLSVPVEPSLEKLAHRLISDPGSFVKNPDTYVAAELRADGAGALRWFKSAENIKLLKSLLADPGRYATADSDGSYAYPARRAAYETLKAWGVGLPEPVMSETFPANAPGATTTQP